MHHRGVRIGTRPYDGKIAGLYDLEETLGSGHFAVVKLARHVFTGEKVAVKVIDKSKLDEVSKAHLFQEVRCMKLVQHPNVVRLYEVIDTATKLYLILELGDGGDLYDYIMRHDTGLSELLAKEYFRQIVRAITYCHQLHVVHRDLKPENVVFFEKLGVVKLTDFGFSNKFCPGQKLETSCGSLAYSAPEILLGDSYDAPAVDVWSLGVILYMLVCGQAPFQEANDSETLTMIMDCKYTVPLHVSQECKDLIACMVVRNPEKRASLAQIAKHPWLSGNTEPNFSLDVLPLVSKEQLPEEDHNLIVQKIVNGNIATKEEIQECLDKNEYNHITATYYLLAERKLRANRQEQANRQRPEHLAVTRNSNANKQNNTASPSPCLLTVPRTPGDVPQRSRKCSIVQEDEEEEDIPSSGREELTVPLNRRGSKSEGRLNLALQERLADLERKNLSEKIEKLTIVQNKTKEPIVLNKLKAHKSPNMSMRSANTPSSIATRVPTNIIETPDVTIITGSATISIPIITTSTSQSCQPILKYKTMPPPTTTITPLSPTSQLNEIFEETEGSPQKTSRQFVSRSQNRSTYEQRKLKFHKNRTASCSSSDASDDDSDKRKKRTHKLNTSSKPLQGRRDSHDDSSDSQEPGSGTGSSGANHVTSSIVAQSTTTNSQSCQNGNTGTTSSTGGSGSGRRQHFSGTQVLIGKRHKNSRRRHGETRLRESQSLNRITEVQEDGAHALVIATTIVGSQGAVIPKTKGIGARLLQGLNNLNTKKQPEEKVNDKTLLVCEGSDDRTGAHISRKDTVKSLNFENIGSDKSDIVTKLVSTDKSTLKKIRILGKYFQVHKKLCIPLTGLFTKNRLYKAQSCGSLVRDKVSLNNENSLKCRQRAVSMLRDGVQQTDGDINRQEEKLQRRRSTVVQLHDVCNELTGICAIHFGPASKCCSFC